MVTPKCGRCFRMEVNASSVLRTIERTSASFRCGLRSDHLHNITVFHRRDSLQHSLAKDTSESSGKWRFTNYLKLRLFELNQRNFCIFILQILLVLCNISKWLKAITVLKQLNLKQCFFAIQIVEKRDWEDLKRAPTFQGRLIKA